MRIEVNPQKLEPQKFHATRYPPTRRVYTCEVMVEGLRDGMPHPRQQEAKKDRIKVTRD